MLALSAFLSSVRPLLDLSLRRKNTLKISSCSLQTFCDTDLYHAFFQLRCPVLLELLPVRVTQTDTVARMSKDGILELQEQQLTQYILTILISTVGVVMTTSELWM